MSTSPVVQISQQRIPLKGKPETLGATLSVPAGARGVVVFAHGSGSSRFSPRNRLVADRLIQAGFATLLADLLTEREDAVDRCTGEYRFDVVLLAGRLTEASAHARAQIGGRALAMGYFGASTGAAAALIAAAQYPLAVSAIVCRGGRPDLAAAALPHVNAPVLLIVGGEDHLVLDLNRRAQALMPVRSELTIVPGATHLFEESGALERVADLAADWFGRYL
jgi:putative phosphoribosyl transferase